MYQEQKLKRQRGSISLLGALSIVAGLSGVYTVMELGNKMIMDRNFDNYAQAIAPVVLRTELALTQAMIENGEGDAARNAAKEMLKSLGHEVDSDVTLDIQFGNMVALDSPATYTNNGITYTYTEEFVPVSFNPSNPKVGLSEGQLPPDFSVVSVEIVESSSISFLPDFRPQGRALYGLSEADINTPDMASCFCDTRYDQCVSAPRKAGGLGDLMGNPDTKSREKYCEYGAAPSSGGPFSAFFGKAKYSEVDSIKFSPQWVGTPYDASEGGNATDQLSASWTTVMRDEPMSIASGKNPFPEASWDAANASWLVGDTPFVYEKTNCTFFGCKTTSQNVSGDFYMGRSGVCADGGIMTAMMSMFTGNTNCSRYTANVNLKYEFAAPIENVMTKLIGATGANQHYYSCRDFSGITKARAGFFQIMMRMFTSPIVSWEKSYQTSSCAVKKMKWHGWWMFGSWRDA